jgi:predicted negative regulator of RcsB-dependent stress response
VAEKKLSRKELLKEPDEFIDTTAKVMDFVRANPKKAAASVIAVALVALGALGVYAYVNHRSVACHDSFERAYKKYRALSADQNASPEKLDEVAREFDAVANDYPSLTYGQTALLYAGHTLYRKGDYKGALERYERMKSTGFERKGLKELLVYHVAMTKLALKEYDQARALFEELSGDPLSPYRREAFAAIAGIYEGQGKNKEAVQAYRQYLKMFPQAPDAPYMRSRMADLAGGAPS